MRGDDWLDAALYFGDFDVAFPRHATTLVRSGEWALDVGAQKGWYAMLLGRAVGPDGIVFAFEPDPRAYVLSETNFARNHLPQIRILPIAAGDREGTAPFFLNETIGWSSRFPNAEQQACVVKEVVVRVACIDDILRESRTPASPPISLVKIDVEGSEWSTLKGMSRLLAEESPTLWLEINRPSLAAAGVSPADIEALLLPHGYRFASPEWDDPFIGRRTLVYHPLESLAERPQKLFDVVAFAPRYASRAHEAFGW